MKKIALFFLLLLISLSLSACGSQVAIPTPVAAPVIVANANVTIQNFSFSPVSLVIKKGTTVIWTNNDSAPHEIKSDLFNSSVLNKGESFSFTFNDAGTFSYICSIHTSMNGTIIVQ